MSRLPYSVKLIWNGFDVFDQVASDAYKLFEKEGVDLIDTRIVWMRARRLDLPGSPHEFTFTALDREEYNEHTTYH